MQEITRRVNMKNIWQAAYTAGAVLPKPVSTTQYWHRSLNPKKLISVGFSRLQVGALPMRSGLRHSTIKKFVRVGDVSMRPGPKDTLLNNLLMTV